MATRGCGNRVAGGIYFECRLSPYGKPLETFLYCPPPPVPPEWALSPVSSRLIGIDVVDWIGETHYPNVLDYVEEVRHLGLSGRLPKNFPFHKLTYRSTFKPVHARAIIDNWMDMLVLFRKEKREADCPLSIETPTLAHRATDGYCSGYWWEDVMGGDSDMRAGWRWSRPVLRERPSFSYYANARPIAFKPDYRPGILGAFPLTRLVVVQGEGAEETYENLSDSVCVPVSLVEE
jgi:hypothetical protein